MRFELPAGRGRKARSVKQEVRIERVRLKDDAKGELELTCVVTAEMEVTAVVIPVVWWLLTNRQATTLAKASELIDWYRAR